VENHQKSSEMEKGLKRTLNGKNNSSFASRKLQFSLSFSLLRPFRASANPCWRGLMELKVGLERFLVNSAVYN